MEQEKQHARRILGAPDDVDAPEVDRAIEAAIAIGCKTGGDIANHAICMLQASQKTYTN